MKNAASRSGFAGSIGMLFLASGAALAQAPAPPTPKITALTTVEITQRDNPPTGPHAVIVEHDPGLATHTIFRPKSLANAKHPVLVWGEGACAKNGLMFTEFLSEIASHGFVVIADGPPVAQGAGPGGPGGPGGPAAGGPRAGGAAGPGAGPRPGPGAGGIPDAATMLNGAALVVAIDWLEAEATREDSRFHNKVDVAHVAAMGMSCGGLMSYGAANDPRVATVGIWNSGLLPNESDPDANAKFYASIHGSIIIVTGGESDIAYANGKRDFELMPAKVPAFHAAYPSVGHGGTYSEDNGGPYGIAAVAWLKWQLQGDAGATGRGFFAGEDCGICEDPKWVTQSRSLP